MHSSCAIPHCREMRNNKNRSNMLSFERLFAQRCSGGRYKRFLLLEFGLLMSDSCLGRKDRDLLCSCSSGCWPVLIMPGADASADAVSIKNSSCGVLGFQQHSVICSRWNQRVENRNIRTDVDKCQPVIALHIHTCRCRCAYLCICTGLHK